MRTLQQIFDLMIKEGYYGPKSTLFMCVATRRALYAEVITPEERTKAVQAIMNYLKKNGWSTVKGGLVVWLQANRSNLHPRLKDALLDHGAMWIYQNWKRRPRKTQGSYDACMRNRVACWIADLKRMENDKS